MKTNKFQIYNGLKPALIRHCIYTACRVNLYENARDNKILKKYKSNNNFYINLH